MIALFSPVKLKLGAHESIEQRRAIIAHYAQDICFDTPGFSLEIVEQFLHILSVFDERQSQAVCFYCFKSALGIKSIKLKGDITGWL